MLHESKFKTVIWYTTVGLLVLLAVVVTVFRLTFSSVAEYREELEIAAGEFLGLPVKISGMDARVVGFSPTVILSDLALLTEKDGQPLTRFESVAVSLKPLSSLQNLRPIIELTVNGADLEVVRKRDNSFAVYGFALTAAGEDKASAGRNGKETLSEEEQALGEWFLSQTRLAVKKSRITLINEKNDEQHTFKNVELELSNSGERHRLNGYVHLPLRLGQKLRVAIDIEGNPLQGSEWSGDAYVQADNINLKQNLTPLSWAEGEIRSGLFNGELWSHWVNGELQTARVLASGAGLLFAQNEKLEILESLELDARLSLNPHGWQMDVADLDLKLQDRDAVPMRFSIVDEDGAIRVEADTLQLAPLAMISKYLPGVSVENRKLVKQLAPGGVISDLHLQLSTDRSIQVAGTVNDLSLSAWKKLPGVNGLDASIQYQGDDLFVRLSSRDAELSLPHLFRDTLILEQLDGELRLHRDSTGWQVMSDALTVANQDISGELAVMMSLPEEAKPWLSLQGRFKDGDARTVPRYLPAGIMSSASLNWLDNAFINGRVVKGSVQYHGQVNHFPFRKNNGRFEVLFDTEAVQLHYQDGWPDLHQVVGEVHFDGPGMHITASQARMFGAELGKTVVDIPDFSVARLLVDGGGRFPAEDGLRFLRESPLSKNVGDVLQQLKASGNAKLGLQLEIPLSKKVRKSHPLRVKGEVHFTDNQLAVSDELTFKRVNGTLHFTEKVFSADNIAAHLANRPVSITVDTGGKRLGTLDIVAKGRSDIRLLGKELKLPFVDHLKGEADWQASLAFADKPSSGTHLKVVSNLQGIESSLPAPLSKKAQSTRNLQVHLYLSGPRRGERRLIIEDTLGLAWQQDDADKLLRAQLRLGASAPLKLPTEKAIELRGRSGKLQYARWRDLLEQYGGDNTGNSLPVSINMEQLHLVSNTKGAGDLGGMSDFKLPELSVAVKQFTYDELELESVAFSAVTRGKYLVFSDISIKKEKHFELTGIGKWVRGGKSRFTLKLASPSLGRMMRHFGVASVIKGGDTNVSGTVWWPGDPLSFSLKKLNAQLAVSIKEGTIVEVDPGAGRMLGILSLTALPRRLFLDFSDVFKKGLNFKSIKGDLKIEKGQAYTNNLRIKSAPASIMVTGRTGLLAQDFEQDVYVVPNVRDTATVASALAWGPQVAAMVALFQEIFKSDIKEATMTRYHISGKWDEPKIERIDKPLSEVHQEGEEGFLLAE